MAYTRATTWTSGQVLTHTALNAEFDAIQADVNAKTGADLTDGTVTTAKLASPNAAFSVTVPLINAADALSAGALATATPGVRLNANTFNVDFDVPVNCTITGLSIFCSASNSAGGTRANTARIFVAGVGIGSGALTFVAGDIAQQTGLSQAVTTTQQLQVRVTTDTAANDGVTNSYAIVHCEAVHQA